MKRTAKTAEMKSLDQRKFLKVKGARYSDLPWGLNKKIYIPVFLEQKPRSKAGISG